MKKLALLAVVGVLLLGACSSDDDSNGDVVDETSDDSALSGASDEGSGADEDAAAEPVDQTSPPGANGVKVDEDGNLWIAVLEIDQILQVDAGTGEILQRVVTTPGSGPDDVVIDGDVLYWTGFLDGTVGQVDLGAGDLAGVQLANVGAGANPIAVRDDGALVVGRAVTASGLFAVEPEVDATPEEIGDPGPINSFDISPEGVLYGPLPGPGAGVVAVDPDTAEVLESFDVPGAAFGVRWFDDQLYVLSLADSAASVFTVDLETGESTLFGTTELGVADNLAVAEDGTVYVTGFDSPTVAVLGPDGEAQESLTIGAG